MARGGGGGGRGVGSGGSSHDGHVVNLASLPPHLRAIVLTIMAVLMFFGAFEHLGRGNGLYSEEQLSDYTAAQYDRFFGDTAAYEDNLLLTFVVYENRTSYSYMCWVGDHIGDEAFEYLQGSGTWLDQMLEDQIAANYEFSLGADLFQAIRELAFKLPDTPYTCWEDHTDSPTALSNQTTLDLNEKLIVEALEDFRETTGIPIVLVIEDATDIFQ